MIEVEGMEWQRNAKKIKNIWPILLHVPHCSSTKAPPNQLILASNLYLTKWVVQINRIETFFEHQSDQLTDTKQSSIDGWKIHFQ